jgi:signal transduction histidine kinase
MQQLDRHEGGQGAAGAAALPEGEAHYRTLLDNIDQGFCLLEMIYGPEGAAVDYRFLRVNRPFERHTGLRDAAGRTARELVPNLEQHWVETYAAVAATGAPLRFEQGSAALGRHFEVEAVRVGAPERRQVALIFTDVTARKLAEADARFLSELGEQIRTAEDAELLLDTAAAMLGREVGADRCFFSEIDERGARWAVRHEFRGDTGFPALAGEHPLTAFPPPILAALRAGRVMAIDDTAADERTADYYAAGYRPVGIGAFATVPLRDDGRWVAGLAVSAAAPRRWAARELTLLEAVAERTWNAVGKLRLAAAQRAHVARLQQLNAASLRINAAPARDEVLRRTAEQARALVPAHQAVTSTTAGQDWSQAINAVSLSEKYAGWRHYDAKTDGSGIYALICQTNRPMRLTQAELEAHPAWRGFGAHAGAHPPLRGWLAVPLVGRDGRNIGLIQLSDRLEGEFTADDEALIVQLAQVAAIALENQQLYAQEQEARAQAEEASRLKDEFLATVSHELRTPLTAFLGYAELLQRRRRDEAYVARTAEKMLQAARAQAELIEDLLDVSRIVSGKLRIEPGPVALPDVIHAALDTVRPTVEAKGLHVQTELDPAAGAVLGDAGRLQQVVWNLLSNAAKFTPVGGGVEVRLRRDGAHAELSVRDTGQGIAPEFLPFVFDRFRQADSSSQRAHGGLGLGLAIVRHLVELHGGAVAAASAGPGRGATFTVRLPLAAPDPSAATAPPDPAGLARGEAGGALRGLRVLVVDDQPSILDLIEELLAAEGATVRSCSTAREALALARGWRPDVLVSDIAMPAEDGYWLIERVRALPPDAGGATPALALTAYVRMEDRLRVLAAGFDLYAPKPVDPAELRAMVLRLATGAP